MLVYVLKQTNLRMFHFLDEAGPGPIKSKYDALDFDALLKEAQRSLHRWNALARLQRPRPVRHSTQNLNQGTSSCLHLNKRKWTLSLVTEDLRTPGQDDTNEHKQLWKHGHKCCLLNAIRDVASGPGFVANRTLFRLLSWRACVLL